MSSKDTAIFAEKSGFGYSKSVNHQPRDIMSVEASAAAPSIENLFNSQSSGMSVMPQDPMQAQAGQDQDLDNATLMEKLHPDKSYQGANFNKQDNMRDVNKVVTDGQKIAQRTDYAKQENDTQKENLRTDFETDKAVAIETLKDCAVQNGMDASAAVDTLAASNESTKMCATTAIFAEAATGGMGSLATLGKAATVATISKQESKKLSPDEQKSLLEDTMRQLQSRKNTNDDSRLSSISGGADAPAPLPSEKSEAQWENFTPEDLEEFLGSNVEDLPEWQALDQIEFDIDQAQENHRYVAENYGQRGDLIAKAEAAAAGGNSNVLQRELDAATVHVNAGDAHLAGESLSGFVMLKLPESVASSMAANNDSFNSVADAGTAMVAVKSSDVETRYDQSRLNQSTLSQELSGFMQKQMQAAFG